MPTPSQGQRVRRPVTKAEAVPCQGNQSGNASISNLGSLSSQSASQLNVFGLDCNALSVDGAKVGVLEEGDEVSLNGLLESTDGRALKSQIRLEVLGDLTNQTLEGELSDEKLSGLLVTTDLTESDGSWLISVGLLDTSGGWCGLASGLGGELLTRSLATSGLAGSLLGTGHFDGC